MESDKLIGELARWALLHQEYDFEVVHRASLTNLDAYALFRNPSPFEEDWTRARWHNDCDKEAVPGWHAIAYLTLTNCTSEQHSNQLDEESDKTRFIGDVWEDLPTLYRLPHGTFLSSASTMEKDWISHQITRFHWENGLLFHVWFDGG